MISAQLAALRGRIQPAGLCIACSRSGAAGVPSMTNTGSPATRATDTSVRGTVSTRGAALGTLALCA